MPNENRCKNKHCCFLSLGTLAIFEIDRPLSYRTPGLADLEGSNEVPSKFVMDGWGGI